MFHAKHIKFSDKKKNIPLLGHQTVFQEAILPIAETDDWLKVSSTI